MLQQAKSLRIYHLFVFFIFSCSHKDSSIKLTANEIFRDLGGPTDDLTICRSPEGINVAAFMSQFLPGLRDHLGLVYDSKRNKVILIAGNGLNENLKYMWHGDTWEWNIGGWKKVIEDGPGKLSSMSVVFDKKKVKRYSLVA